MSVKTTLESIIQGYEKQISELKETIASQNKEIEELYLQIGRNEEKEYCEEM